MRIFCLLMLLGCDASPAAGQDQSVPDLAGVDFFGVDFAQVPDLSVIPDLAGVDFSGVDFRSPPQPDFGGADLTNGVPAVFDLAGDDLKSLASFCAGTFVAGTCVADFFAPLQFCFTPSGSCTQQGGIANGAWCWPNGAELKQLAGANTVERWYKESGGTVCYTRLSGGAGPGGLAYTSGSETLYLDTSNGSYHCPDGSQGSIGANYGGCAALQQMIDPTMTGCASGTCP
jgi:hypothetical protein